MRRRRASATLLAALFVALIAGGFYLGVVNPVTDHITKGLDLAGGVHVVLEAQDTPGSPATPEAVRTAMEVIRRRVDSLGVAEPVIQMWGNDRIVVDLPQADPERALAVIGRTAQLEFLGPEGNVILTGENLVRAQAAFSRGNTPVVSLTFDDEGRRNFAEATRRLVGRQIAIVIDDETVTSPVVNEPITAGQAEITGLDSIEEAQNISVALSSGALPVELEVIENRSVSALLGRASIARSQRAAVYGIVAVITYMLLAYRLPGLLANAALALYLMILLGALALVNATLTLPGIAGIILSVGMAVDANVIIFERVREELRLGKTVRSAIDAGFRNALRAILDANVTTLIATTALFVWGTGPVRGFAVTLTIGVLSSMFTAIVITRFLLRRVVDAGLVRNPARVFGLKRAVQA